mmetsp:Transcript_38979/g.63889  ORF Transcript_38979/g.63889 Transcript_38979/m.63889 type:complete len:499 (-) Transcript_38979:305-1801(-)
MAQENPSVSTPSAGGVKEDFRTPFMLDSGATRSAAAAKDRPSIEELERALKESSSAQAEVLELFKSFYGDSEAISWYKQVKANYFAYSDDDRPIFKRLSGLELERRRLQNDLFLAKKRSEYSSMSIEDLTEVVVSIEARLQQSEAAAMQRSGKLTGKHLLLVGGVISGNLRTAQCISIDLETGEHVRPRDLHTARSEPAVVAIGSRVYVAGGMTDASAQWTQAFEVYDYVSHRWEILANIPEVLSNIEGCAHGRNVIIWGNGGSGALMVFMYDTSKRSWETIPSPPVTLIRTVVPNSNPTRYSNPDPPVFGCVGKTLFFFESQQGNSQFSLYDLELPSPRWQQNDFFENTNMQTLHHILRQRGPISNTTTSPMRCFFRGPEVAFVKTSQTSAPFTYNSNTGFKADLHGTWGKTLIAFANDLAVFRMHTGTLASVSHTPAPGSANNALCIRIISSQVEKYLDFIHVDVQSEKQIENFAAVIVDAMEMQASISSDEASPS